MLAWRCSQRNMLSCAFQETAVYGEHIWFETSVSGDFCYVGEQNCMAKLLVSYWDYLPSQQGLQMQALLPPIQETTKATLLLLGGMWGAAKAGNVSLLSACWSAASSISAGAGAQFAVGACSGCHSPGGYMMIFQGEAVGSHTLRGTIQIQDLSIEEKSEYWKPRPCCLLTLQAALIFWGCCHSPFPVCRLSPACGARHGAVMPSCACPQCRPASMMLSGSVRRR